MRRATLTARRNQVIVSAVLLIGLSVAGVAVSELDRRVAVEVSNTTLEPGEQGFVTIVAKNIGVMTPLNREDRGVLLRTDEATFDVPPDQIQQSDPPNWVWAEPKAPLNNPVDRVSVRIPVEIDEDAESREYTFEFSAGKGSRDGQRTTFVVSVTVSGESVRGFRASGAMLRDIPDD